MDSPKTAMKSRRRSAALPLRKESLREILEVATMVSQPGGLVDRYVTPAITMLGRITDGYYQMFRDHPVMHRIWQATQGDRTLQSIDEEDVTFLAGLLCDALHRVAPKQPAPALTTFSQLAMIQIAAAVRHAISLPSADARRMLDLFKRMLPSDLSALR